MKLVIGDKNQSSWSMRPWLVLKHFGIAFDEVLIRLGQPDSTENILAHSPSGKVPCLVTDAGDAVWESLAIMETLAELYPQHALWPRDAASRAHARSISAEMHAGFNDLREQMSMNIQRQAFGQPLTAGALSNVKRIDKIWSSCLSVHSGPFLFGKEFGIADAMFAPVVMRFNSYAPKISEAARAYCQTITTMTEVAEWIEGARKEQ